MGLLAGVGSAIAGAGAWLGGGLAAATGIGAETAGLVGAGLVDAGVGAGLGAGEAAITGGDPGTGALLGGITGGAVGGFGGLAGDALGIGAVGGDALVGAGAGAVGAGITGGNPLTGALEGGASGAASGLIGSMGGDGASTGTVPGGTSSAGTSAAAVAPPPGVSGVTDLTAGLDTSAITDPTLGGLAGGAGGGTAGVGALTSGVSASPATAGASGLTALNAPGLTSEAVTAGNLGSVPGLGGGAGGAGASGSGGAGTESSIDKAWDNPTSGNILHALGQNAGPLVAGGGLLMALTGSQNVPGQSEIGDIAGGLQTEGGKLESYIQNGTLPPGAQAGIDQATKASQAAIRSKYASAGMSGSSAEVQDINNIAQQKAALQFQEADSLLKTGLDATSTSGQLYADMMNFDAQQSAVTGQAIASLAGALSGGGTTIRLG